MATIQGGSSRPQRGKHTQEQTSKGKHALGGELQQQPPPTTLPSQTTNTNKDDLQIAIQMAKDATQAATTAAELHAQAVAELERKRAAAKEVAATYIAAETVLKEAQAKAATPGSSILDNQAAVTGFEAAQVQHKAADLAKTAAAQAERAAAWTAQQAAAEAETAHVIVDQLVDQLIASGTHKPKPKHPQLSQNPHQTTNITH
jgi:membrane protein involved in colicin uptake